MDVDEEEEFSEMEDSGDEDPNVIENITKLRTAEIFEIAKIKA